LKVQAVWILPIPRIFVPAHLPLEQILNLFRLCSFCGLGREKRQKENQAKKGQRIHDRDAGGVQHGTIFRHLPPPRKGISVKSSTLSSP
jgi:hypothetical protein